MIVLKWILNNQSGRACTGLNCSRIRTIGGSSESDDGPSGFVTGCEVLDWLNDY
jgi:hypothetical protein